MSQNRFALGALIGIAAGVVAGILTAPKSGKETRADLKLKAHELRDQATDATDTAKTKAVDTAEDVKAKAEDLRERTEHAIEGAKRGFRDNR